MARVGTRVYSTDCTVLSRYNSIIYINGICELHTVLYTCVQYRLYSRESLHSIQLYTLMVWYLGYLHITVITQSLLYECLLNVFGNTVTNHSRCTRHSGVRMHSSQ